MKSNEKKLMFKTGAAILSLRDSGHSFSTALSEVIDNSLEANANEISVYLYETSGPKGKKHVNKVAVIDDGDGMDIITLANYMIIGFSTRYMQTNTMGKYGVGAKLAALNFGRRIDTWSKKIDGKWRHVYFDLDEALEQENRGEDVFLNPPDTASVPTEYASSMKHGTIVVWSKVDRLENGRLADNFDQLKSELHTDLSRMFRRFIHDGIKIRVDGQVLLPHDPLFLMTDTWADMVLSKHVAKAAGKNPPSVSEHFGALEIADEEIEVGDYKARLRVTLYPKEVTRMRYKGRDTFAKKLNVPENQGSISFVRKNREISYTNVPKIFPSAVKDPDRFIGIEVSFNPELDEYFGVRNVKRGVEPHGELRTKLREKLSVFLKQARKLLDKAWGEAAKAERIHVGEHFSMMQAVKEAAATMPKSRVALQGTPEKERKVLEKLAEDSGNSTEEKKVAYLEQIKDLPVIIESVDYPGKSFITIQHLSNTVIVNLNTRHPFYKEMWKPMADLVVGDLAGVTVDETLAVIRRSAEALNLLISGYALAQQRETDPASKYDDLTEEWGWRLDSLMKKVKNVY